MSDPTKEDHPRTRPELSIVIPAHNEELRIVPTLQRYAGYFKGRAELVVVPNGCTDKTYEVVSALRGTLPSTLKIINIPDAIGKKGHAIIEGFKQASGARIGFVDADVATTPEEYDRLSAMLGSYDMVFGSRWIKGAKVFHRTSFVRKIASRSFVILVKVLFGLPYHDTQCGVKIFTHDALQRVLPHLSTVDAAIDVELLLAARHVGLSVHEEPTTWTDNDSSVYSTTPFKFYRTSLIMFRSLLRLRKKSFATHSYEK